MTVPGDTDVLRTGEAGGKVIRGGVLRGGGYAAGVLLGAATSVLLLRHLGVEDFGRYGIVIALIGIVSAVTDAGLTAVGSRELAILPAAERPALMRNLVGLRIGLTAAGVVAAIGFAALVGYPGVVVAGTALAGFGILLLNTQSTLMMPLSIELRMGAITLIETLRHGLTLVGVAVLVLGGAALLPFFGVQIVVGGIVLLLTPLLVARVAEMRPALDRATARALLRESLPLAAALAMNVIYLRLVVILVSLGTDEVETGLFATSFRIFEILLGVPTLVLAVALPLLAVAGAEDRPRLRYALQRLTETAVAVSLLLVLVTVLLAEPAIRLLFPEFVDAAPILQIQAFALLGVFVSQTWTLGLVALRRQRDVAIANGITLVAVIVLGVVLVGRYEGIGGAVAAVATETLLALLLFAFLARAGRDVVPNLRFLPRPLLAGAAAALVTLLPIGPWVAAPLAAAVFVAVAFAVGAVPGEVLTALRRRDGA
ncbi:MAG: polysaccharide biosynthesis C-terminal domain-containing protein [Actinobacteria bacterium]|nr:polysaccharide biosynthesis C-terminal domain-containing protein [Actinomycetota bacterium]